MDAVADTRYRRDKSTVILSWQGYQYYHSQCRPSVINSIARYAAPYLRERVDSLVSRRSSRCARRSKMKEACERENQLRKAEGEEEEEEHDDDDDHDEDEDEEEEDEERNGDEGGVSARSGYLQNHSRTSYISRSLPRARYRFNFKLKFMNGLLPFCQIRLRTFSGPGRRTILPGRDSAAVTLARRGPRYPQGRLFNKTSSARLGARRLQL